MKPIVITPGEPAGIGPDIVLSLDVTQYDRPLLVVASIELLRARAAQLDIFPMLKLWQSGQTLKAGVLHVLDIPLCVPCQAGQITAMNAAYVMRTLEQAVALCDQGLAHALVTGPVNKAIMIEGGFDFSGHTEVLSRWLGVDTVVMLLVNGDLRVALQTTHLPLAKVPEAIKQTEVEVKLAIIHASLMMQFGIKKPKIAVCGLNPHAGEQGTLGREEIDVIIPVVQACQKKGWGVDGPYPADTLFTPENVSGFDAVLAMYHDQGLPPLKARGLASSVNVTLGLPIIRTSVGHGTALDLAGTGNADPASLKSAIDLAIALKTGQT